MVFPSFDIMLSHPFSIDPERMKPADVFGDWTVSDFSSYVMIFYLARKRIANVGLLLLIKGIELLSRSELA